MAGVPGPSNTNISTFRELFRFQSRMSTLGKHTVCNGPETELRWRAQRNGLGAYLLAITRVDLVKREHAKN